MYIKEQFKSDPKQFNSDEMNLKIIYKMQHERDLKLQMAGED
jgi:hypothetical protein